MAFIKGLMQRCTAKTPHGVQNFITQRTEKRTSRRRLFDRDKACACDFVDNYLIKIPPGYSFADSLELLREIVPPHRFLLGHFSLPLGTR